MKYTFRISAEVEIEAENVAQAYIQAKKLGLISRGEPIGNRVMISGGSRPKHNRDFVMYRVVQRFFDIYFLCYEKTLDNL